MGRPKIHYPRFGLKKAICGSVKDAGTATAFLSSAKKERCKTCEKDLRASGSPVDSWIKIAGGEV